jgi:hypothetical protein
MRKKDPYEDWMTGQFGSMIGGVPQEAQFSPVMPQTTAQEVTSLGGQGFEQQAAMDSLKQDAMLNSSPNPVDGGGGEFDFKAISKALGGGEDTFKFNTPDMKLSRGAPPPVQAMAPAQPQQPLSTAMGAIESANQLYGMPQPMQQPQQQQQPAILRRMLGLA